MININEIKVLKSINEIIKNDNKDNLDINL